MIACLVAIISITETKAWMLLTQTKSSRNSRIGNEQFWTLKMTRVNIVCMMTMVLLEGVTNDLNKTIMYPGVVMTMFDHPMSVYKIKSIDSN